jgi:cell division protein ZapA
VSSERDSVTVEIFGHEYKIKGHDDPEYMTQLAQYVDRKMREIAQGTPVGSARIGILVALNIADELFKERNEKRRVMEDVDAAASKMRRKLEEIV